MLNWSQIRQSKQRKQRTSRRHVGVEPKHSIPNSAVIRQQMGHTTAAMTRLYSGRIPVESVEAAYSKGAKSAQLENMENGVAA